MSQAPSPETQDTLRPPTADVLSRVHFDTGEGRFWIDKLEATLIDCAMQRTGGNPSAARRLGIARARRAYRLEPNWRHDPGT